MFLSCGELAIFMKYNFFSLEDYLKTKEKPKEEEKEVKRVQPKVKNPQSPI